MSRQRIEDVIHDVLRGGARERALEFAGHLRANEMLFERGCGYWEDKFYWLVTYKNEYVCFILINDAGEMGASWTIWSDESPSNWFEDFPLDERMKEIAWEHVDFCGNCGGDCTPGARKIVFGREFHNVCRTTMKFDDPDAEALVCAKKMVDIRKIDISERGEA